MNAKHSLKQLRSNCRNPSTHCNLVSQKRNQPKLRVFLGFASKHSAGDITIIVVARKQFRIILGLVLLVSACTSTPIATPALTEQPAASPSATPTSVPFDGGRIAFVSARDGNMEIYTANSDGTFLRRMFSHPADDWSPDWSPDSKWIAFVSNRDGNPELYMGNYETGEVLRLTDHEAADDQPGWSPDGERIVFVSDRDGVPNLYVLEISSLRVEELTESDTPNTSPDWSPDGTRIVFVSERDGNPEIYVMRADGTRPQRLTNSPGPDTDPAWSPDGEQIAYVIIDKDQNDSQIYVMDKDGRNARSLTSLEKKSSPAWSPDGSEIVYSEGSHSHWWISVARSDGSEIRHITPYAAFDYYAVWGDAPAITLNSPWFGPPRLFRQPSSSGSSRILAGVWSQKETIVYLGIEYSQIPLGKPWRMLMTHESGYHIVQSGFWDSSSSGSFEVYFELPTSLDPGIWTGSLFVEGRLNQEFSFRVVPQDDRRIVFSSGGQVSLINADGTNVVRIGDHHNGLVSVDFSPDQTKVALGVFGDDILRILIMARDGMDEYLLPDITAKAFSPRWSPDGNHIAFISQQDGQKEIYIIEPNGEGLVRLRDIQLGGLENALAWSPQGDRLAIITNVGSDIFQTDIFVLSLSGGEPTRLTTDMRYKDSLDWSPDGTKIAFSVWVNGNRGIGLLDLISGEQRILTKWPTEENCPRWSRDGREILFVSDASGLDAQLYILDLESGIIRQITADGGGGYCPDW